MSTTRLALLNGSQRSSPILMPYSGHHQQMNSANLSYFTVFCSFLISVIFLVWEPGSSYSHFLYPEELQDTLMFSEDTGLPDSPPAWLDGLIMSVVSFTFHKRVFKSRPKAPFLLLHSSMCHCCCETIIYTLFRLLIQKVTDLYRWDVNASFMLRPF